MSTSPPRQDGAIPSLTVHSQFKGINGQRSIDFVYFKMFAYSLETGTDYSLSKPAPTHMSQEEVRPVPSSLTPILTTSTVKTGRRMFQQHIKTVQFLASACGSLVRVQMPWPVLKRFGAKSLPKKLSEIQQPVERLSDGHQNLAPCSHWHGSQQTGGKFFFLRKILIRSKMVFSTST